MIAHFLGSESVQRRAGLTLFVVVFALLAAGGVVTTPAPRDDAAVGSVDAFECALPQDVAGFLAAPTPTRQVGDRPARGTVPDTFDPIMAVVCDIDLGPQVSADGTATYAEHHYSGNFGAAVRELNAPSKRRTLFPGGCGDSSYPAPVDMWLVDAEGRAMEPSYPLSDCGFELTFGLSEVESLTEIDRIEHRIRIDAAGISRFFSCSPTFTSPTPGSVSQLDLPLYFVPSFCRLDVSGPAGVFLGAERYDDSEVLGRGPLADLPLAPPCSQDATTVATTVATTASGTYNEAGEPIEMVIELDGCRRVLLDGYVPSIAPPELVNAILTKLN